MPSIIIVKTVIGKHSVNEGTNVVHGKPLTKEVIKSIRHMNIIEEEYKRADKIMRQDIKEQKRLKVDKKTEKRRSEVITQNKDVKKQGVNTVKKTKAKKNGPNKIQPIKKKR